MDIKYISHFYKLSVKKSNDNLDYFTPLIEKIVPVDEIDIVNQNFLNKSETISKIDSKAKYYNKYCREWKDGDKTFLEYIMGLVSLNQD